MEEREIEALAREVLTLSRNTLLVNLRFLDAALSQFTYTPGPYPFASNGEALLFSPRHVLLRWREEREAAVRDYLHLVLHGVFRHMFVHTLVDRRLWDLSCDIAVESAISGLVLGCTAAKRQKGQEPVLERLRENVGTVTAEKVYRWYQDHPPGDLETLQALFRGDDHAPWYLPPEERRAGREAVRLEERWKDISRRMQVDLETFSRERGDQAGDLTQNLRAVNRERYDYTAFLKKFAVRGEVMRLNPDEFDTVFYTYGLKRYGNMPLIEPLEYREVKRIREFVIAIDTSGSVAGELVQQFVQKTYNVLKSTESFFSKVNIHIIQCDAEIQEDVRITSQEEFDAYLKTMEIRGLGGTDFRPVFDRVEALRRAKEFTNLKGLIYFTDGYGVFPAQKPDYAAAFVFIEEGYIDPSVPPWAIKLVLQKEEI
ncbi:MAG: metallopeptidase [Oscillibacter sp.]|nr:metallopeptidase [Oscillibacter sp.]